MVASNSLEGPLAKIWSYKVEIEDLTNAILAVDINVICLLSLLYFFLAELVSCSYQTVTGGKLQTGETSYIFTLQTIINLRSVFELRLAARPAVYLDCI